MRTCAISASTEINRSLPKTQSKRTIFELMLSHSSLLQNPESEFDFFAARGEMEGAGAPFLA
jgi:hypothetical protein